MKKVFVTKKSVETVNGTKVMVTKKYSVLLTGTEELMYRIKCSNLFHRSLDRWIRNNLEIPVNAEASPMYDIDPVTGEKMNIFSRYRKIWNDGDYVLMAMYSVRGHLDEIAVTDIDRNFYLAFEGLSDHNPRTYVRYKSNYLFPWEK